MAELSDDLIINILNYDKTYKHIKNCLVLSKYYNERCIKILLEAIKLKAIFNMLKNRTVFITKFVRTDKIINVLKSSYRLREETPILIF